MTFQQNFGHKSFLSNTTGYLSGSIDFCSHNGVGWRQEIKRKFNMNGLSNIRLLDPTSKPASFKSETDKEQELIKQYKQNKEWDKLTNLVKEFRRTDLRFVDHSHFVIGYINTDIHACGTYDELIGAERQCKPVFAVTVGGKEKMPSWLFGIVPYKNMFDTIDELIKHLVKLDSGEIPLDNKWVLV